VRYHGIKKSTTNSNVIPVLAQWLRLQTKSPRLGVLILGAGQFFLFFLKAVMAGSPAAAWQGPSLLVLVKKNPTVIQAITAGSQNRHRWRHSLLVFKPKPTVMSRCSSRVAGALLSPTRQLYFKKNLPRLLAPYKMALGREPLNVQVLPPSCCLFFTSFSLSHLRHPLWPLHIQISISVVIRKDGAHKRY
jgi:hypothetical protein